VGDEPGLGHQSPVGPHPPLGVGWEPGTGGERHPDVGLVGLRLELDQVVAGRARAEHVQVAAVQVAVALHPGVHDPAVQARADLQRPRPVLGHEGGLQPREVLIVHAHEPALDHAGATALVVPPAQVPDERPLPQVELQAVIQDVGADVEPRPVGHAEVEWQPVGEVDELLVLDRAAGDLGPEPVVQARDVGARVVDPVGMGLRQGGASHEVAVAQRAQCLPESLALGIEAVVDERPHARRRHVSLAALGGRPPLLEPACRHGLQGNVVERGHHQVRAGICEQFPVAEAGHAERRHPARFGRPDAAGGVLHREATVRRDAQLPGRGQKPPRVWLAAREIAPGDAAVEQVEQGEPLADEPVAEPLGRGEGIQADLAKEWAGVPGRPRRHDVDAEVLDGQDEAERIGEGNRPARLQEDSVDIEDRAPVRHDPQAPRGAGWR
jgi:hypothetical protein